MRAYWLIENVSWYNSERSIYHEYSVCIEHEPSHPIIHLSKSAHIPFLSFPSFYIVVGSSLPYSILPHCLPARTTYLTNTLKSNYFDFYTRQGRMAEAEAMFLQALQGFERA